eukprot:6591355-Ditylum_brightwellii.AAC.1
MCGKIQVRKPQGVDKLENPAEPCCPEQAVQVTRESSQATGLSILGVLDKDEEESSGEDEDDKEKEKKDENQSSASVVAPAGITKDTYNSSM